MSIHNWPWPWQGFWRFWSSHSIRLSVYCTHSDDVDDDYEQEYEHSLLWESFMWQFIVTFKYKDLSTSKWHPEPMFQKKQIWHRYDISATILVLLFKVNTCTVDLDWSIAVVEFIHNVGSLKHFPLRKVNTATCRWCSIDENILIQLYLHSTMCTKWPSHRSETESLVELCLFEQQQHLLVPSMYSLWPVHLWKRCMVSTVLQ